MSMCINWRIGVSFVIKKQNFHGVRIKWLFNKRGLSGRQRSILIKMHFFNKLEFKKRLTWIFNEIVLHLLMNDEKKSPHILVDSHKKYKIDFLWLTSHKYKIYVVVAIWFYLYLCFLFNALGRIIIKSLSNYWRTRGVL